MKLHILLSLLVLLGTVIAEQQPTTISFLVEYQDQQQEDYIELGLVVSAEGSSLVNVMSQALKIAEEIKNIATQFCQAHAKKKSDCKDIVQIGNYDINPKYQIVKRQSKFMGFEVQHEVAIKVLAVDHISDLADTILKEPDTKIVSFEWKPLVQVDMDEAAIKQGIQQGEQLCDQLGMHLKSHGDVEQLTDAQTEETVVYQFVVQCLPGKVAKKQVKQEVKSPKDSKVDDKKQDKKEDKKEEQKPKKQVKKQQKKQKKAEDKKAGKPAVNEL